MGHSEGEAGEGPAADELVGIVLAAGAARRFGDPKQLLPFAGTTLLGRVIANAEAASFDRVVVVLGRAADEVRERVELGRAEAVDNRRYASGCASSLLAGLDAAGDCAGIALLLGDQPGVTAPILDTLAAAWRRDRRWGLIASYRGAPGHPFLFSRDAFDDLRGLHGDKAVWKLLEQHPERIARVEIDAELPPDVDTPGDYERALAHWHRHAGSET